MSEPMSPAGLPIPPLSPYTTPAELAAIVSTHRQSWADVAGHPSAYPELLNWLQANGDERVRAVIAARAVASAPPVTPVAPVPQTPMAPMAPTVPIAPIAPTVPMTPMAPTVPTTPMAPTMPMSTTPPFAPTAPQMPMAPQMPTAPGMNAAYPSFAPASPPMSVGSPKAVMENGGLRKIAAILFFVGAALSLGGLIFADSCAEARSWDFYPFKWAISVQVANCRPFAVWTVYLVLATIGLALSGVLLIMAKMTLRQAGIIIGGFVSLFTLISVIVFYAVHSESKSTALRDIQLAINYLTPLALAVILLLLMLGAIKSSRAWRITYVVLVAAALFLSKLLYAFLVLMLPDQYYWVSFSTWFLDLFTGNVTNFLIYGALALLVFALPVKAKPTLPTVPIGFGTGPGTVNPFAPN